MNTSDTFDKRLYVVGQRSNGSYETFELTADEGSAIDTASEVCSARRLKYIHCSRSKGGSPRD
jgi:hypothetical protein